MRERARLIAATIATILGGNIQGRIAKYDDTFNPRAFGDLMQQWGTSTVLIESGALPGDPEKQRLRALNVAGILGALDAIATGSYHTRGPGSLRISPLQLDSGERSRDTRWPAGITRSASHSGRCRDQL